MDERRNDLPDRASVSPSSTGFGRPGSQESNTAPKYDPHVPDESLLNEMQEQDPDALNTPAGHAEAFRSTAGEELRPKDGTLDGGTAR